MKIFYVLRIKDRALSDCLEAIRFLCNPAEKHSAHITVRGPYHKRIDIAPINRKIVGDIVEIHSVGNFFDFGQNTVFFGCAARELKNVWNKPDFPFNPHLTVYDSDSGEFARSIFDVISRYKYSIRFQADELEAIEAKKGQGSFSLALAFNSELVKQVSGRELAAKDVHDLSEKSRLDLIDRLAYYLANFPQRVRSAETDLSLPIGALPPVR